MKHPTHEALRRLRLYGMAHGLEDLERQPERSQLSFDDQLALLVERETAERANTALASRLKRARLRQTACLEDRDWRTPRGLDRTLVRDLASCRWVREHQPLLVTGPTGIGKTFVACALGNQAAREGYGVFHTRLTRLLDDLATARLAGPRRLARLEVLIIDDWAMTELTAAQRLDLMEVIDDRHDRAATVLATQIPVANWHRSEMPLTPMRSWTALFTAHCASNSRASPCAGYGRQTRSQLNLYRHRGTTGHTSIR